MNIIRRYFFSIVDYFKYDIPQGIKNLIIWFPVIWKDGTWDEHFIYEILRHKIKLMEKRFRKNGSFCGCEGVANNMKVCILLLDRLIDDNYYEIAFRSHDKKWGELIISSKETDNPYLSEMIFDRPNIKSEKDAIQERKEYKKWSDLWHYLQKQDREYLFHIMNRTIMTWWD